MNDVVLVTGSESLLGRKLIEKLLARGRRVIAPVAGRETERSESSSSRLTVMTWNRSSWFSTKAVVRESLRMGNRISQAIVLHQAPRATLPFRETESGDVEEILDDVIKGSLALIREVQPFLEDCDGSLAMVIPYRPTPVIHPIDAMGTGAFSAFSEALFQELNQKAWAAGFSSDSPDAENFAEAIIVQSEHRNEKLRGRWLCYSEGRKPFGGTRITNTHK